MVKKTDGKSKNYEIDMCTGPLFGKIVSFTVPLMLSGILQLLFNAADMIVVGQFAGNNDLAAVGATGPLINLIVNVFMGLSVGANVMVAGYYGSNQKDELSDMVHTAIFTSLVSGVILIFIGFFVSPPALRLMGTPDEVQNLAVVYMRIFFVGMPATMAYNFGSAILRAVGDTKRPLYYLSFAGIINVILNLVFVCIFSMGVAGVALATTISQFISAILVLRCLMRSDSDYRLEIRKLRIVPHKFMQMLRIGLPAGLQGAIFSISNVLIQSSVNSFGPLAMAGNSAASNIEGFVYMSMNTLHQTAVSFSSQNFGARKYKRIGVICRECLLIVIVVGLVMGNCAFLFGHPLLSLYSKDEEVIAFGMRRLLFICCPYFICGIMDTLVGCIRGMGYAIMPMLVSLTGACLLRIVWIYTVFQKYRSLDVLYLSYPVTWIVTAIVHAICFLVIYHKWKNKGEAGRD